MDNVFWADVFMALRCLLSSAIVFSLCYSLLPFDSKAKKWGIIATVTLLGVASAGLTLLYHLTRDNPLILNSVFVPVFLTAGFALLLLFFRDDLPYSLFCFVLALTVYLILGFPSELLKNALRDDFFLSNGLYLLLRVAALALLFPFFFLFLRPRLLRSEREIGHHWLLPFAVSSLVFLLLVFIGVYPVDWAQRDSSIYYLIGYSGFFVFGFYLSLYFFVENLLKQKRKELDQQAMSKKIEALENRIEQDEAYQETLGKKEHDLHHHIAALKGLLQSGETSESLLYLEQYEKENVPLARPFHTGSKALDGLLVLYLSYFQKEKIRFDCVLSLGDDFPLSDSEIVGLFANALENAYRGVLSADASDPFVTLEGQKEKGFYTFRLKNSAKPISFKNDLPLRSDSTSGIGCQNMVDVLSKHGGFSSFSYAGGVFVFEAALPPKNS